MWFNLRKKNSNVLEVSTRLLFLRLSPTAVLNLRDNNGDFSQYETKRQLGVIRGLQDLTECTIEATQHVGTDTGVRESKIIRLIFA